MYVNSQNRYKFNDVVRTWEGTTVNGTGGFVPASIRGGEIYSGEMSAATINRILNPLNCEATVMLIDAETGFVLNADRKKVGYISGVEEVISEPESVKVGVENGDVVVTVPGDADVNVFRLDGSMISITSGNGIITCPTAGNKGVAIVMVKTKNGIVTRKVML